MLGGYTAAVAFRYRTRRTDPLVAWAMVTLFVICAFFFSLSLFASNPFAAAATVVEDGQGPNQLLQNHVLVLFHPPMLYLGYVGMSVPFAFAIAALVTGRVGEGWLLETRRWTLFAWGFLSIGIILGGWWSYEVLGWGGVWGWDPVENASFLPWLTATAYIHSVLVQERRGMLRVWNLSLLIATFCLTILGTFLTRSGVLNSVHAFSESAIGPYLLGFLAVVVVVSLGLDRLARRPAAVTGHDRLADLARRRVPREQRAVRGVRLRRAPRHRLPARRAGGRRSRHPGRRSVLRPPRHADRHRPAVPDGRRARAAVAQGVAGAPARPPVLAGVVRRRRDRRRGRWPAPTASRRCSRSGSPGSPPDRRSASWSWRRAARVCAGSSAGPTAA